jgi:hypothetical protein
LRRAPTVAWLKTVAVWALVLLGFTASLMLFTLANRQPIPAPLPAGYVAR